MKTIRIFISSPGDVARERHSTADVLRRLQDEFSEHAVLQPYFWEWEPVDFAKDYQANIPSTAEFDIVICLLWSRLGSRLGQQHKLPPDYTQAANSGTEYELLQALHGKQQHPEGLPDLLVWVNKAPPPPATSPPLTKEERDERHRQTDALHDFLSKLTRDARTGVFTAAVNGYCIPAAELGQYQYLDQFEEVMEQKLRKLIQKHVGSITLKPKAQWAGSPFRDLDVFEFEHAPIFFGRTRAVGEVVRLLQETARALQPCQFALVLGASGSGKSSLARAGVLPMLTRPGVIEGIGLWRCAIMRPSDDSSDLFISLAAALLRGGSEGPPGPEARPAALPELADPEAASAVRTLADKLRSDPQSVALRVELSLAEAARAEVAGQRREVEAQIIAFTQQGRSADADNRQQALLQLTTPPVARLVLLLDQMEELFTLHYAPEHLRTFLAAIDVLARCGRVFVLGTLRSDFYPRYQGQPQLVALTTDGARYDLVPPTGEEISQIVRRPASLAGLVFEEDSHTRHSLADTLRDETLSDFEALPLLEHVLNRLYEAQMVRGDGCLTFADHQALGGVGGALGRHAEATFTGEHAKNGAVPHAWDEGTFDAVFRCLVTLSDGEQEVPNRRTVTYAHLIASAPHAKALTDTFIHERLFVADQDTQHGQSVVRLSHEALLTRWPRLAQWLQTAQVRDFMSMRRRLQSWSQQWEASKRGDYGLLPDGLPMEEAKQLMAQHATLLSAEEAEYIEASRRHHESLKVRLNARRQRVLFSWMLLSVLAVAGACFSIIQWQSTARQRTVALQREAEAKAQRAQSLMIQGVQVLQRQDPRGLSYLVESLRAKPEHNPAIVPLLASLHLRAWPRLIVRGPELEEDESLVDLKCSLADDLSLSFQRPGEDQNPEEAQRYRDYVNSRGYRESAFVPSTAPPPAAKISWKPDIDTRPLRAVTLYTDPKEEPKEGTKEEPETDSKESQSISVPGTWKKITELNAREAVWVNKEAKLWLVTSFTQGGSGIEFGPISHEGDITPLFAYNKATRCLLVLSGRIVGRSEYGGGESVRLTPAIYRLDDAWIQSSGIVSESDSDRPPEEEQPASEARNGGLPPKQVAQIKELIKIQDMKYGERAEFEKSPDGKWITVRVTKHLWLFRAAPLELVSDLTLDWAYSAGGVFIHWSPDSRYLVAYSAEEAYWERPTIMDVNALSHPVQLSHLQAAMFGPHLFSKDSHWYWSDAEYGNRMFGHEAENFRGGSFLFDLPSKGSATSLSLPAMPEKEDVPRHSAALEAMKTLFAQETAPPWLLHLTSALVGWGLDDAGALVRLDDPDQLMQSAVRELEAAEDGSLKQWGESWLARFDKPSLIHRVHFVWTDLSEEERTVIIARMNLKEKGPCSDVMIEFALRNAYSTGLITNLDVSASDSDSGEGKDLEIKVVGIPESERKRTQ